MKYKKQEKTVPLFSITDQRYVILSFCSKITLLWITVCAIIYNITESEAWYRGLLASAFAPLGLTIFFLALSYQQKRRIREAIDKDESVNLSAWEGLFFWLYVDDPEATVTTRLVKETTIRGRLHF